MSSLSHQPCPIDRPGQGQARSHEEGRPVDGVEPQNVLSDELDVGRPELLVAGHVPVVADGRDVVVEGVEPDVDRMLGVARHGDAPLDGRPGDAEVLEPAADEARDLVEAALRPDELGVLLVEIGGAGPGRRTAGKSRSPRRRPRPSCRSRGRSCSRRPRAATSSGQEILVGDAVPALVFALIDVALVEEHLEELLDALLVEVHGRPDEEIVGDVEGLPQVLGPADDRVGQGLRRQALLGRRFLDLLAVFVRPGQEKDLLPGRFVEAGQGVGDDRRVGVPDVGHVVDVVDRRRDVERLLRIR